VPTLEHLLGFLEREGALEIGAGSEPWPSLPDDAEIYEVDWDTLIPAGGADSQVADAEGWPLSDDVIAMGLGGEPPARGGAEGAGGTNRAIRWDRCAW
jgi:hypothetical protein